MKMHRKQMLVPLSLRWPLVTTVPQRRLREESKIPSAIFILLDYSLLEKPRLLSTTLFHHCPSPPHSSWCCCSAASLMTVVLCADPVWLSRLVGLSWSVTLIISSFSLQPGAVGVAGDFQEWVDFPAFAVTA